MKVNLGTIDVSDVTRREIRKLGGKSGLATRAEILKCLKPTGELKIRYRPDKAPPRGEENADRALSRLQAALRCALPSLRRAVPFLVLEAHRSGALDAAEAIDALERVSGLAGLLRENLPGRLSSAIGGRNDARDEALDLLDQLEAEGGGQ